jgi:hypothetical protein
MASMYERMLSNAESRFEDFDNQTERYRKGEIGLFDQMLQGGANAVGLISDVPAELFMTGAAAVTPEWVKQGLKDVASGIAETETAQAAIAYLDQNPDVAKRIGYAADLAEVIPGVKAAKGLAQAPKKGLQEASLEWSNKQPWFYGSGKVGQLGSALVTAPRAAANVLNPKGVASRREGMPLSVSQTAKVISKDRINRIDDLNSKPKDSLTDAETGEIRQFKKDLSFLEGQLDQTQLLQYGRGTDRQGIIKAFEDVQAEALGALDAETVKTAVNKSRPLAARNIKLDNDDLETITNRIRNAQGVKEGENAIAVVRNPTAFSDLAKDTQRGSSKEATRIYHARDAYKKYFPDAKEFTDDALVEFAAMSKLPDMTLVNRATGKDATRYEKFLYKMIESDKVKGRQEGKDKDLIDKYYRYKKDTADGKKLTKPQQEIYNGLIARVEKQKEVLDIKDGKVFFQGSHKSSAKGLGGVNDQFLIKKNGDFVHFINDENDFFNLTVPGDSRVISVAVPNGYNVFNEGKTNSTNVDPRKRNLQSILQSYGAEPVSAKREGLLQQTAEAINNTKPELRMGDYKPLAATGGMLGGTAVAGAYQDNEM